MLPIFMAILLGVAGVFYLDLSTRAMQNGVDVLAKLAAQDPGWRSKVASEDERTHCNANPPQPDVTYPDGNSDPGSRLLLTWQCRLSTKWVFDGLPITVSAEGVIE